MHIFPLFYNHNHIVPFLFWNITYNRSKPKWTGKEEQFNATIASVFYGEEKKERDSDYLKPKL